MMTRTLSLLFVFALSHGAILGTVGCVVGASVGLGVGPGDGAAVVGACEGSGVVGMAVVGSAVGDGVGWADGRAVVGENVGPWVGAAVGAHATVSVEDCA